jgi:hypothetical protein
MVPDVATGDTEAMLCLNCAKRIVAPTTKHKYAGLTNHLKFRAAFTSTVKLSFARIDGLIGSNLPMEAYRDQLWWSNTMNGHSKGWLDAGWETQEINLKEGYVTFQKVRDVPFAKSQASKMTIDKPFTPVPVRPYKRKPPSKTKLSKLYARLKNLERQNQAGSNIPGLKAKSQYQKKLFKSNEKPK